MIKTQRGGVHIKWHIGSPVFRMFTYRPIVVNNNLTTLFPVL